MLEILDNLTKLPLPHYYCCNPGAAKRNLNIVRRLAELNAFPFVNTDRDSLRVMDAVPQHGYWLELGKDNRWNDAEFRRSLIKGVKAAMRGRRQPALWCLHLEGVKLSVARGHDWLDAMDTMFPDVPGVCYGAPDYGVGGRPKGVWVANPHHPSCDLYMACSPLASVKLYENGVRSGHPKWIPCINTVGRYCDCRDANVPIEEDDLWHFWREAQADRTEAEVEALVRVLRAYHKRGMFSGFMLWPSLFDPRGDATGEARRILVQIAMMARAWNR